MSHPQRKLRVGVSLHLRNGHQSIWENGIFQNCVFLVQLLARSPQVERAWLVVGGETDVAHEAMQLQHAGVEMMDMAQALHALDVMVEMSSQVADEWSREFRARGGRLAWMRVGNDYVIDIERAIFDKPPASLCSDKVYDAIWTLPEYERSCTDYFAITARAPVRIVPHLWTPLFFQRGIDTLPEGARWGYQPGRPRWRLCCFEPNVCMVKTSFVPMALCEEAYRARPSRIESVRLANTLHLKEQVQFVHFARSLDIVNHGLASFEARFAVYEFMAHHGDCIVSHHWENGQNYLYYEALYGGYPLVHNSEFIRDCGYYYPEFDCQEGGRALLDAMDRHDRELDDYRRRGNALLQRLDVAYPGNIEAYTRELLALFER